MALPAFTVTEVSVNRWAVTDSAGTGWARDGSRQAVIKGLYYADTTGTFGLVVSLIDALGMGLGFTWGLFVLGGIRELLGSGRFLGLAVMPEAFDPARVMIMPAGAFLALGFLVAFMNRIER